MPSKEDAIMYYSTNRLKGFALHALDGEIGKVVDFCFHDSSWYVRYLVVEVGGLLRSRKVLVAAPLTGHFDTGHRTIDVIMNQKAVLGSPELSGERIVSAHHEKELFDHYGWPSYWNGFSHDETYGPGNPWLPHPEELGLEEESGDPHLRSVSEVEGYRVLAEDGTVGHVEDFVVDDEVWGIRYLVTRTRTWLSAKNVLVVPEWVQSISWEDSEVLVDHKCDEVKNCQELVDD